MNAQVPVVGLSVAELTAALEATGLEAKAARMRARQLWNWVYVHGQRDFAAMTNLAKDFRARMSEQMSLSRPEIVTEQISEDGTRKWLLRTAPGIEFETVYIPEEDRGTLCVSSQVGCTLNCRFCHTGTQKLVRNLTPYEIVGQVMVARDALSDFYVEPAHPGRIPRVGLYEWRTAFGVTTPHELAAARTLRSEGRGEAECEPGNAERAGSGHGV